MTAPVAAGGWETLIGPGFAEALQQGLSRVAQSAPSGGAIARNLAPRVVIGAPSGPLREHVDAVLRRFESALPGVLSAGDRWDTTVRGPLVEWAGAVLAAAFGAGSAPALAPGRQPSTLHLSVASSLLMECAVLQMMENGCLDEPSLRALGEAVREAGAGGDEAGQSACCWREQRRISRELHDEVANGVSTARLLLERCETAAAPEDSDRIAAAGHALTHADTRLRALIRGERERTALPALDTAIRRFASRITPEGVRLSVRMTGDEGLIPDARRRDLYLVVCEALRNSLAHSAARRVKVVVRSTRWWAYASVEDDGRGFDVARALRPGHDHQGFRSMTERMEDIGGRLTVSSSPLEGTHVEAHLPLRPHAQGARARSTHL